MTVKPDARALLGCLVSMTLVACGGAPSPEDPAGAPGTASVHVQVGTIAAADLPVYYSSLNPPVISDFNQSVAARDRVVVRGTGFTSANAGDGITVSIFSGSQLLAQHEVGASAPRCNPFTGICTGGGVMGTTFSPDEIGGPYFPAACDPAQPPPNPFASGLRIEAHDDTVGYTVAQTIWDAAYMCEKP